ncbi:MAG TPA: ParB/RepB/Spo0J family partition protein [Bacteroidetes bacterium]|nr:ParB/RepB/Spo0J family partition protein [Bacteroidota bacterium]
MAKKVHKKQLGLGVRALLSSMDATAKATTEENVKALSGTVAMIPVGQIEVNPFQPRKDFDEKALQELAASLKTYGLIQPLTVRRLNNEAYQLISGERRLRAAKIAGLKEIPAYVRLADDQEMIEMALVENIQRQNLNAIEVAITYRRLIDECQLTHDGLAERVGKERSTITNYLNLLSLPPHIQQSLKNGAISMGHARELSRVKDVAAQSHIFNEVIDKKLSVRQTEMLVRQYKEPNKKKTGNTPNDLSGDYKAVQDNLRNYLGAKVALKVKPNGSGQITIPFSSTNDLNRLLDLIEG